MKKQYKKPVVSVHRIVPQRMVCGSIKSISGLQELVVSNQDTEIAEITEGNSRDSKAWDDDDYDEDEY
jgi:hypothetical protein